MKHIETAVAKRLDEGTAKKLAFSKRELTRLQGEIDKAMGKVASIKITDNSGNFDLMKLRELDKATRTLDLLRRAAQYHTGVVYSLDPKPRR